MDNRVVYRAAKSVVEAGLAALRFNFRGVGASTGTFDEGIGEQDDVRTVVDWLKGKYADLPLALAGFSFGSWVGLEVGCRDERVCALVGLGLPLNFYDFDFLSENARPTLLIVGTEDEFCATQRLDRLERRLPTASVVRRVLGADHFFKDQLDEVQTLIKEFLLRCVSEEVAR
jgi:alpha/beta superfamily hydrolase